HIEVKVYEALSGDGSAGAAHPVAGVAGGAGKAVVDVAGMLSEGGIGNDVGEVVALSAQGIGADDAEIRTGKEIDDQQTGSGGLAELVAAFENVRPLRAVGAVRSGAAEFAIVIAVVAVSAEDLDAHGASRSRSVLVQHEGAQAGLGVGTGADMGHGVARSRQLSKLRNDVQGVAGGHGPDRQVAEGGGHYGLPGAGPVAAETVLELVDGGIQHGNAVRRADSLDPVLRRA